MTTKRIEDEGMKREGDGNTPDGEFARKRKRLLARVAGHVSGGLLISPSPKVDNAEKIAQVAVDIAEAILKKVGL